MENLSVQIHLRAKQIHVGMFVFHGTMKINNRTPKLLTAYGETSLHNKLQDVLRRCIKT